MLRFACFKGTFSKFFWGSIPETPPKKLGRFAPSKSFAVLGLNFSYFFIGELKTLMIVLKAMTAYIKALNITIGLPSFGIG